MNGSGDFPAPPDGRRPAFDLSFDATIRERLGAHCAAFPRREPADEGGALKRAAVAMTLVERDGELAFLLTRRAASLRAHAGQFALPGGRIDAGESGPQAALRELREEVGLDCDERDVLGALDDYETRSGYLMTPIVVFAGAGRALRPNPGEVAHIHVIRFSETLGEDFARFDTIAESDRPLLRLNMLDDWIHAPTAAVIYQFREWLLGRATRVAHMEQPLFAWR